MYKEGLTLKKFIVFILVSFILVLSACSNDSIQANVEELEKKIEEQEKIIEQQKLKIEQLEQSLENNKNTLTDSDESANVSANPTLKLGETYSDENIEVTISQINYVSSPNNGVQVYFEVTNKSETPLELPGTFKFKLDNQQFEEEFNSIGYTINFEPYGYIYQGEKRSGNYHYLYERDVKVIEITYFIQESGYATQPVATWIIE